MNSVILWRRINPARSPSMYELQYVPLALPFFLFFVGLFVFLVILIQLHVLQFAYAKLGLSSAQRCLCCCISISQSQSSRNERSGLAKSLMDIRPPPSSSSFCSCLLYCFISLARLTYPSRHRVCCSPERRATSQTNLELVVMRVIIRPDHAPTQIRITCHDLSAFFAR
jgi:hypothetical protein